MQRARGLATEIRELGDATGNVVVQVVGCHNDGFLCFFLGGIRRRSGIPGEGPRALSSGATAFLRPHYVFDQLVVMRSHLSWPLASLGHLDRAFGPARRGIGRGAPLSHPPTLAIALAGTGILCVHCGPGLLLKEYADELLALATEHRFEHFRMMALIERGWSLAGLGRADEGIALLAAGLAGLRDHGFIVWTPWALTLLADACRAAGQWPAALAHLAEARGLAEEREVRWFQAETLRLAGDVLLATSDAAAAEVSYQEAMAIAQQQSAKLWELRAAASLARLWREQGKRAEAHALLAPVYGWFTEGLDTNLLKDAKALLEELAAPGLPESEGLAAAGATAAGG